MLRRTLTLDGVGASLSLSAISSLLLALQWGGGEKAWSSREVIAVGTLQSVAGCANQASVSFLRLCWQSCLCFGSAVWEMVPWCRSLFLRRGFRFTRSAALRY